MTSETDSRDDLETEGQPRRKAWRIDVSDRDDCLIFINQSAYMIRDISLAGIGLKLPIKDSFELGEVIGDILKCQVEICGRSIKSLDYRLVYLSPATGDCMRCGMEWVNRNLDVEAVLQDLLAEL